MNRFIDDDPYGDDEEHPHSTLGNVIWGIAVWGSTVLMIAAIWYAVTRAMR